MHGTLRYKAQVLKTNQLEHLETLFQTFSESVEETLKAGKEIIGPV